MSSKNPFSTFGLESALLPALTELGYEDATPIQKLSIPVLMQGEDLLAQAQTGTGKTAAFALPILSRIDIKLNKPQALIIAPTRELAIQVAEAFQSYAKHLPGFHVTPIYGGQSYDIQLRALKRGVHVIVGTPGRVMDHLRRKTLSVAALKTIVLDEADEMLKMGFIEDIEWILEQIPHAHQTALFSATMPAFIQKISKRYLKDAKKIQIKSKENTVEAIEQFYIRAAGNQKLDVLTRLLEIEDVQASIIFARTKTCAADLAERLQARGYAAAALHGDMSQALREKVVGRLRKGSLDFVVATDVAARGIDVERISHVINYDIPHDTESYIHRIGRTGRAGRKGKAFLFVTPREQRLLKDIERAIHKPIEQVEPPSIKEMSEKRSQQLSEKIIGIIEKSKKLGPFREMVFNIMEQKGCTSEDIAAALVYLNQQANPLPTNELEAPRDEPEGRRRRPRGPRSGGGRSSGGRKPSGEKSSGRKRSPRSSSTSKASSGERSDRGKRPSRSSSTSKTLSGKRKPFKSKSGASRSAPSKNRSRRK